jgi:hypothetical protein
MKTTYFISVADVKNYTSVNFNVEDKVISMAIWDAQETYIQMGLGTKLYNKIKTMVEATAVTGNYKILLDTYIYPALIRWSLVEVLPFATLRVENKSTVQTGLDGTVNLDLEQLKYFINLNKDKAEFYNQRMIDYLIANMNIFPEYTQVNTFDEMPASQNAYFSGMQLDIPMDPSIWLRDNRPNRERWM